MEKPTPIEKFALYLNSMTDARAFATPETSYYTPLSNLLNSIGNELNPKVVALGQLRNIGYGIPDFGFYTATQNKRNKNQASSNETPARGVAEVKKLNDNIDDLLNSEQTAKYAQGYGLVLATNYRQFALAEYNKGKIKEISRYSFAATEEEFWKKAQHPQKFATESGVALCEFLHRALLHNAPITSAQDVAAVLASYARETLALLEKNNDDDFVNTLKESLQGALSMEFTGNEGAHFFHSTLSQTIFYGLFSAWMITPKNFDWRSAGFTIKTPVMRALFSEIVNPDKLGRLGLEKLLDGATAALNRVEGKESLFGGMDAAAAIQHFYEPFLADFDPILRKELGVWYTPPEIVKYMVERADRVLRNELKITDGFADETVYVLDPCGGTGAYIAEVLRRIHKTCQDRGDGDLAASVVNTAAQKRIFGFEILSASYVVAHWQIGALLSELGKPLKQDERAAIYLTNSLTDWTEDEQIKLPIPALQDELTAANKIKRKKPILVILGNPPYNAFAGTSPKEENDLVAPYKEGLVNQWGIKKFNLDDLYVRFFRMAENRITTTGKGIVSFISNYSYTTEPSFVVMRQSLLNSFDKIWIDSLNGDSRKTGKKTPDGNPDPSIFSALMNPQGIRVGTAIGMYVRTKSKNINTNPLKRTIKFRNFWGTKKREELLASLEPSNLDSQYEIANPREWNKFSFNSLNVSDDFLQWVKLCELYESMENGMVEARSGALIDIAREPLEDRMRNYFNADLDWETYRKKDGSLEKNASDSNAKDTRQKVLTQKFNPENIAPYTMKAFDNGFCYYTDIRPVWNRNRPKLWEQFKPGNSFLISRPKNPIDNEGSSMFFSSCLVDYSVMVWSRCIPFYLHENDSLHGETKRANLSQKARQYLQDLNFKNPDEDTEAAEIIWLHSLAIGYSPAYQNENIDGLKIDWPRIPLPPPPRQKYIKEISRIGRATSRFIGHAKTIKLTKRNRKTIKRYSDTDR